MNDVDIIVEMWLAHKLELKSGMRVLDVGCGVGGPMRTIARYFVVYYFFFPFFGKYMYTSFFFSLAVYFQYATIVYLLSLMKLLFFNRFSGAHIVGLNNNEYQIERGKRLNEQTGLSSLCSFIKADFMKVY